MCDLDDDDLYVLRRVRDRAFGERNRDGEGTEGERLRRCYDEIIQKVAHNQNGNSIETGNYGR